MCGILSVKMSRCPLALSCLVVVMAVLVSDPCAYGIGGVDQAGPYKIGHVSFDAVDQARGDRTLPTEVWYPVDPEALTPTPHLYQLRYSPTAVWEFPSPFVGGYEDAPVSTAGSFPLVVVSHGMGGSSWPHGGLGESLASHGYVVVIPRHMGDTWEELRFWPERYSGFTNANSRLRLQDVSFLIDEMQRWNDDPSGMLAGAIDLGHVGVAGHSYGAMTSQITTIGFQGLPADERVKAIVPIDDPELLSNADYATVTAPTLLVGQATWNQTVHQLLKSAPDLDRVDVLKADHLSFVAGECQVSPILKDMGAPQEVIDFVDAGWFLPPSPACDSASIDIDEAQRITNESIISFFDRTLKLDITAGIIRPGDAATASVRVVQTTSNDPGHPLAVLIEDPVGRRIGFDPMTGEFVNDFGDQATYDNSGNDAFRLPPIVGEYLMTGIGIAAEGYQIKTRVKVSLADADLSRRQVLAEGMATPGEPLTPITFSLLAVPEPGSLSLVLICIISCVLASRWRLR